MRAFLISIATMIVIAVVSLFALGSLQKSSGVAYSTSSTRVSSSYMRRIAQATMENATCQDISAWQAIFIDFSNQSEDEVACGS